MSHVKAEAKMRKEWKMVLALAVTAVVLVAAKVLLLNWLSQF
jgi:NADH:ubiquinone oxidoreductase subunit H